MISGMEGLEAISKMFYAYHGHVRPVPFRSSSAPVLCTSLSIPSFHLDVYSICVIIRKNPQRPPKPGQRQKADCMRFILILFLLLLAFAGSAQDLEPRTLSSAPVGLNFVGTGYQYSVGNVLFDPSLPIEDAQAKMHGTVFAYVRTIDFFGMSGKVDVVVPFVLNSDWKGQVDGQPETTSRTGFPDPQIRFSFNFIGSPAISPEDFIGNQERTIAGLSIQVRPPLGEYDADKLINLGSNRWTIRPHVGISHRFGKFITEGHFSIWIFTPNPDLLGTRLTQKPIYAIKGHVTYLFGKGIWLALDAGAGFGGRTTVDTFPRENQQTFRLGGTFNFPFAKVHAIKLRFVSGVLTRVGGDFDSVTLAYQFMWMKKRRAKK